MVVYEAKNPCRVAVVIVGTLCTLPLGAMEEDPLSSVDPALLKTHLHKIHRIYEAIFFKFDQATALDPGPPTDLDYLDLASPKSLASPTGPSDPPETTALLDIGSPMLPEPSSSTEISDFNSSWRSPLSQELASPQDQKMSSDESPHSSKFGAAIQRFRSLPGKGFRRLRSDSLRSLRGTSSGDQGSPKDPKTPSIGESPHSSSKLSAAIQRFNSVGSMRPRSKSLRAQRGGSLRSLQSSHVHNPHGGSFCTLSSPGKEDSQLHATLSINTLTQRGFIINDMLYETREYCNMALKLLEEDPASPDTNERITSCYVSATHLITNAHQHAKTIPPRIDPLEWHNFWRELLSYQATTSSPII